MRSALALIALLAAAPCLAPPAAAYKLEARVVKRTLSNGMRVLVLPRHQSPVVSFCLKFKAGAVDEPEGRTGMAHLLEHMLFKGTRRLGTTDWVKEEPLLGRIDEAASRLDDLLRLREEKGAGAVPEARLEELRRELAALRAEEEQYVVNEEIDSLYTRNGGEDSNAFTDIDMTTYKVDLPANRLPLWAAIESDRMQNPIFRDFYAERDVVLEERRQSYDSHPERLLLELFTATAFLAHPYRRPVIGWPSDIKYLSRAATEEFFRKHYVPDNAVLAVVGDVEPDLVFETVESHFGSIPPSGAGERLITREPAQRGERRAYLEADANPSLYIGFHKPTLPHRDDYVLDIIDGILSNGRTSRLHRRLVEQEQAAVSVGTGNGFPGARYDNLFIISATTLSSRTPEEAEALIYRELERLKTEPAQADELAKVKKQLKADFTRGLQSNGGLAATLSYFEAAAGDWRYIARHAEVLDSITPEEIMEVARRYFTPENRTVAILRKKP